MAGTSSALLGRPPLLSAHAARGARGGRAGVGCGLWVCPPGSKVGIAQQSHSGVKQCSLQRRAPRALQHLCLLLLPIIPRAVGVRPSGGGIAGLGVLTGGAAQPSHLRTVRPSHTALSAGCSGRRASEADRGAGRTDLPRESAQRSARSFAAVSAVYMYCLGAEMKGRGAHHII